MPYDPRQDPKYKDNKLFLSLINQESRFNPNAVSPTGARGFAQILPSTARSPGFGIAANPTALSDPEQNVAFGKAYFDAMHKRYNGDSAAALVAYNGGPGAADRWVKAGKDDSVISKESSNYYKKILGSAGMDFSKIKAKLPKDVATSEDDSDEETAQSTGFAKLKKPGTKDAAKPSEDSADEAEEADNTTEEPIAKVKKTKKSKDEDDEDDDEEDDDEGSKKSKSDGGWGKLKKISAGEMTEFTPGEAFKPVPIQLGIPKLKIGPLEMFDNPRDR